MGSLHGMDERLDGFGKRVLLPLNGDRLITKEHVQI